MYIPLSFVTSLGPGKGVPRPFLGPKPVRQPELHTPLPWRKPWPWWGDHCVTTCPKGRLHQIAPLYTECEKGRPGHRPNRSSAVLCAHRDRGRRRIGVRPTLRN